MAEAFQARIQLSDEVNEDRFRDAVVIGRLSADDTSVSFSISSIGFNTYLSLSPDKARELGAALVAAADAAPGEA